MVKNGIGSAVVMSLLWGLATVAVGCGDDANSVAPFVGTWEYTQSDGTLTCTGVNQPEAFSGRKTWGEGVVSDLVDLTEDCNYRFTVKGKVATIDAMQTCLLPSGDTEAPVAWRFSLLSATTAEEVMMTSVQGTSCTFSISSNLTKVSKN